MALRGRRINNFVELWCLVASGDMEIWGTIIQQNYWSFYHSEPFSLDQFNMIHPVFWSLKKTLCDMIDLFSYLVLLLFYLTLDYRLHTLMLFCYFLCLLFSKICCRFSFRSFLNSLISSHCVNFLMDLNLFPFFLPSPLLNLFRLSFFWMIVIWPRK